MRQEHDYSLKAHNTFGIEARCKRFIEFENVDELRQVINDIGNELRQGEPMLLLGGGSNLLLTGQFNGTVLHSAIKGHEATTTPDGILLRCGSGEVWDDIVDLCVKNHWHGMENLSLIPGEVGASAVQNIGAYGAEAKDIIYKVEAIDLATGEPRQIANKECEYAYRYSKFKGEWRNRYIITHVTYRLSNTFSPQLDYGNIRSELQRQGMDNPTAQQLREVIISIRNAKLPDPKQEGNAGSFFMNPVVERSVYEHLAAQYEGMPHYDVDDRHVKIPAGWMIDQCGWKGKTMGKAGVHDKQALVLVNRGGATGQEILDLCNAIRKDVYQRFGIDIHPEVNIV